MFCGVLMLVNVILQVFVKDSRRPLYGLNGMPAETMDINRQLISQVVQMCIAPST